MDRLRTLPQALHDAAQSGEGYTFITRGVCERHEYADIEQTALRVAGALRETGLKRGDLVALMMTDAEGFLTALFGASLAGLVPAPLAPPAMTGEPAKQFELTAGVLRAARARAVVTDSSLVMGLSAVRAACPDLEFVLSRENLDRAPLDGAWSPRLDDVALVQFTSGSTSSPKGVALSHQNLAANIEAINGAAGLATTSADSAVSWLPLFHDMGLVGMALGPLYAGRPAILMTPQAFIKRPAEWLKAISRFRATVSFAPNFAYDLTLRRVRESDLEGLDLSCWRVAGCGAETVHAPTLAAFADRFAAVGFRATSFLPSYGLAEHVLAVTLPPRNRKPRVEQASSGGFVSCGRPLPGHHLRIVKEDGQEAPEGEIGEITLAGPSVMLGYFGDVPTTVSTIRHGWLHTGDLGFLSGGELFVCGRAKELIIASGRKHHPQDLEWAVDGVDGVRRGHVVAFGIPQPGAPDRVVLVVEVNAHAPLETLAASIRRRISDALGLYVDEVIPVPSGAIGRTTSGKLRRAAARDEYLRAGYDRSPARAGHPF
jgi:acyl-CoA synthetase (AMP-forming)/AMP-acid ligase II